MRSSRKEHQQRGERDHAASVSRASWSSLSLSVAPSISTSSCSGARALAIGAAMPGWALSQARAIAPWLAPVSAGDHVHHAQHRQALVEEPVHPGAAVPTARNRRCVRYLPVRKPGGEPEERQVGDAALDAQLLQVSPYSPRLTRLYSFWSTV